MNVLEWFDAFRSGARVEICSDVYGNGAGVHLRCRRWNAPWIDAMGHDFMEAVEHLRSCVETMNATATDHLAKIRELQATLHEERQDLCQQIASREPVSSPLNVARAEYGREVGDRLFDENNMRKPFKGIA